jgi:DNA polymerase-3 subunit chi
LPKLLRKVHAAGKRAVVLLPAETVSQINQALWTHDEAEFLPHATHADPDWVQSRSPLLLTPELGDVAGRSVLINMQPDLPDGLDRFERVLELVTLQDDDRQAARHRWKHYTQAGYAIEQFDVSKVAA